MAPVITKSCLSTRQISGQHAENAISARMLVSRTQMDPRAIQHLRLDQGSENCFSQQSRTFASYCCPSSQVLRRLQIQSLTVLAKNAAILQPNLQQARNAVPGQTKEKEHELHAHHLENSSFKRAIPTSQIEKR